MSNSKTWKWLRETYKHETGILSFNFSMYAFSKFNNYNKKIAIVLSGTSVTTTCYHNVNYIIMEWLTHTQIAEMLGQSLVGN